MGFQSYHFYCISSSSISREVFPSGFRDTKISWALENGQKFYRKKFNGELTFGTYSYARNEIGVYENRKDDYDYFYDQEQISPCDRIDFLITRDNQVYFEGYFSTSDGKFDLDKCTFTVTPKTTDDYSAWDEGGELEYNILDVAHNISVVCGEWVYTRNAWLMTVVRYLAGQVFSGCTVTSHLFEDTNDYVTLKPSKLNYLTIAAKSDIKRPTSSNPATMSKMSFNEMMSILKMFNAYWKYNIVTNNIQIEHCSYWGAEAGLDLRTQTISAKANKYVYDKGGMPRYEKFSFMEAQSADFIADLIWYDSDCVDPMLKSEYANRVTTEIELIQSIVTEEVSISDEGWVILANFENGGSYYNYFGAGIRDTTVRFNIPLSWSYLHYCYFRHERVLLDGYMNFVYQQFVSCAKNRLQEIPAIDCVDFDPEKYITTELGETYFGGEKGSVKSAELTPMGELSLNLVYGFPSNVNEGAIGLTKVINVIEGLAASELYVYFSEPNVYDTFFWIVTNGATCQEIKIDAGECYQLVSITDPNPIVAIAYNFSDASLSGWTKVVNGDTGYNTTATTCGTGGSGGSPPPVPGVPTFIGATQSTTCGPVRVSWNAEADATYYILQRKPDYDLNDNWITLGTPTGTYFDDYDAGTHDGVLYTYRLAACNISGCSAYSAELEFTPMC